MSHGVRCPALGFVPREDGDCLLLWYPSDQESDTAPLDRKYLSTITIHDRLFQQYAIENLIYFVPIDEV